ncbi:MAG: TonB-dependent receptor [Sphingomonadales bacterium]|nr:MAG: TonB-dependent receptor [Sphingomonadales bacterium]
MREDIMRTHTRILLLALGAGTAHTAIAAQQVAENETVDSGAGTEAVAADGDIVVTALKREQAVNSVPMSITAVTGDALIQLGVTDLLSLQKVVPGFFTQDSSYGTPVYYLRGVGFYEQSAIVKSPVGVYIDEVPLPYPVMSAGASFDLERVEVLKGPQGTLFGANATGGAINYVAAKPTRDFQAKINGSYGRFDIARLGGSISGPLSDTLAARVSLQHESGGDWQTSLTRPDDTIGARNFTQGRFQLLWEPGDAFSAHFTASGFTDRSDTQQAQFVGAFAQTPTTVLAPGLLTYPIADRGREADWNARFPLKKDNSLYQLALRADADLTDDITLTSISAYSKYKQDQGLDADGTDLTIVGLHVTGDLESYNQELRLAGTLGSAGQWVVGGNYEKSNAFENNLNDVGLSTTSRTFRALGLPDINLVSFEGWSRFESYAIFGNLDYDLGDLVTVHLGGRYTDTDLDFEGCTRTLGNNSFGIGVARLLGITAPAVGSCATLVTTPTGLNFGLARKSLPEDNFSWRIGIDFKPAANQLIYANVSRGYKSGAFSSLAGSAEGQYVPAVQEELTAYEVGFKSALADRRVQLNGAFFYYDYKDKQLRGRTQVPVFNFLEALINIPKSRVQGAELQLTATPVDGLKITAGGVYVDTKITANYSNFTQFGQLASFKARNFPYTPKWQLNADVAYDFAVNGDLDAYVGAGITHRSSTSGDFVPDPRVAIDAYTLLDLRAGIEDANGKWRIGLYGRNITNEYYWTTATRRSDAIVRFAGMPATYGIDFSVSF